ncbi:MAG: hypothetical protein AVDCRST_MAG11-1615 [uncultured Gemmatimonadaceae bacterium]|uniref:DUF5916 domain-containing protein n=1 Tax=uncultured Gemmatimonadaceae bacterium TaxID=246130 RepID=A0A6J4KSN5_9BACT|nr:MAG: hypothetical protein AVDCRST_MAG11-1615 [uncultured Gemmatimonadaceae bacterium]
MLNPAALLLAALATTVVPPPTVYNGRANQLDVAPPRLEGAGVEVDGRLDEAEWAKAALLTGFSQFTPVDGVAAQDSTEVLVWYSPTAIHFGVRAFERHGTVNATLADRDRIFGDDYVQILLGTFDDGRQALVFSVNPLGVQADGALVETGQRGSGFAAGPAREQADLSQDFVYQSKGRVTPGGYEVEIRIPFKSIRYQSAAVQRWRLNVVRRVQHSGYEDSWAPARRSGASFLAQSGALSGLTDLRRGLVLDAIPTVTQRTAGAPRLALDGARDGWRYRGATPELGGNVRWGVTNNLTLNGTANPDFSQVEADAGQVQFDPRQALFFAERRPFFLDGIEQFTTPSRLVYTRRIVQPVAAAKLTGKVRGTDVAFLSAVDDEAASARGTNPVFNILRLQRDIGGQSRLGLAYTDKVDGGDYNRVASVDGRFVVGRIYNAQFQLAGSRTAGRLATVDGPLWTARLGRTGRRLNVNYSVDGIDPDFRTQSGFISRPGVVNAALDHRVTFFGRPGALVESFTVGPQLLGTWRYRNFTRRGDMQDKKLHLNSNAQLRGGWQVGASVLTETFGYDPQLYAGYAVERTLPGGAVDTVPFTGTPRIPNLDYVFSLGTPQWKRLSASSLFVWGRDENFFEWASADILFAEVNADVRPTEKLRLNARYVHQSYDRRTDGSTVGIRRIPRLKAEYQLARPVFVRVVGQYDASRRDALRDDSRTGFPLLIRDASGTYVRAGREAGRQFRADYLFSYQPTPGTVLFAGYGSTLDDPAPLDDRRSRLDRTSDGFFLKASYLFRM